MQNRYTSYPPPRRRGKRRIRGRFYVFLVVFLALIGLGVWGLISLFSGNELYTLSYGRLEEDALSDALLVRREQSEPLASYSRIQYKATEDQDVSAGDEILTVFSLGYSSSYVEELETIRGKIAEIQERNLLSGVRDTDIERFDQLILEKTDEVLTFARGDRAGVRFVDVERDLTELMQSRQEFIKGKQNETGDTELNELYNEEKEYEMKIQSWLTTYTAAVDGRVSYLFDGYEYFLTPETIPTLTVAGVSEMIKSTSPPEIPADQKDTALPNIYRIVTPDEWYVLMIAKSDWSFGIGTECEISFEGFEDMQFTATVESMKDDESGSLLVVLNVAEDMGPLINARKVKAILGGRVEGIMLPQKAIFETASGAGVYLADASFVPVELKSMDDYGYALVAPVQEGALTPGMQIRMKQP